MDQNEEENNASQDKFLNDLISSKSRLQTQSHLGFSMSQQVKSILNAGAAGGGAINKNSAEGHGDQYAAGAELQKSGNKQFGGAEGSSPAANFLKQSQFTD